MAQFLGRAEHALGTSPGLGAQHGAPPQTRGRGEGRDSQAHDDHVRYCLLAPGRKKSLPFLLCPKGSS